MIEKGQRRAGRKCVQPQRHLGEFDGHRILVDAVDAALEHKPLDQVLVAELVVADDPSVLFGFGADFRPNVGEARAPVATHNRAHVTSCCASIISVVT